MRTLVRAVSERKSLLLRLDPAVHDAVARWAQDELRSSNAQIEFLLRDALTRAGRLPRSVSGKSRARQVQAQQGERQRAG